MKDTLERIHIVLVEPKNAGNIGSVVRAMKNMGLSRLHLVNPVPFRDEVEQRKMGYRSQEIIAGADQFFVDDQETVQDFFLFLQACRFLKLAPDGGIGQLGVYFFYLLSFFG